MRSLSTSLLLVALSGGLLAADDLWNGKNLDGWTVVTDPDKDASATWSVRDGVIACTGTPRGYLRTNSPHENYRLRLQWRWPGKPGNSGVFVHGATPDKVWPHCYEAQLQAGNAGEIRANGGAKFREDSKPEDRSIAKVAESSERPAGEWNDYEIVARGSELTLLVNGVKQNGLSGAALTSGWIALQSEGAPIEFRAIVLEPLPAERTALLIAGPPSHAAGEHEHNAGVQLLAKCLAGVPGLKTRVALNGWPADPAALAGADAVLFLSDGGRRHPALAGLSALTPLMERGAGIGLVHYATEPTKTEGGPELLKWAGGFFEVNRSVNPLWEAQLMLPTAHPITRGVRPFRLKDEWYFHLRFPEGMKGVTPLLTAVPPASTLERPDGPHEGNPSVREAVAAGDHQTLAWAFERADGGRGFGFTGGHRHENWGHDDFRKVVLNAVVWLARLDVPKEGVTSAVTEADLAANLDPKQKKPPAP
jgi:hypothetical protein